jgi:Fic family protein
MEQQQFIQSSERIFDLSQPDINYLVTNYSPKILKVYLERVLYYMYEAEDDGSRKTGSIVVRAAISNSMKKYTAFSLASIGSALGKNHATVIHQNRNHEIYYKSFPEYRTYYDHCCFIVKNISKLVVKAANSYIDLSKQNIDYMEQLKREEKTRQRKLDKLGGTIRSIKSILNKTITNQEKLYLIDEVIKKKGDLIDPL